MAKDQGSLSGFRDLLSEQMLPRDNVLATIKAVYELYGFTPLKTPVLERYETLSGKYGEEGNKLMYQFKDNGGRHVALRYDHTVPLARVIAQHGTKLPKPYKRYVVGDVWRGESPQAGRYREFMQFDADIVGASSYLADTEILAMMSDSMSAIGATVTVKVNDRKILDGLAEAYGINDHKMFLKLVGAIDKVDKVGVSAVLDEIKNVFDEAVMGTVKLFLEIEGSFGQKLDKILSLTQTENTKAGIDNLRNILSTLELAGYQNIVFDQTIARGLDYYTGTVYETILNDLPQIGSVSSGGRFDNLIEQLGGSNTPAVGTSIGVDRLMEGLKQLGLVNKIHTRTKAYITNLDSSMDKKRFALAQQLRKAGVPTEINYDDRKLGKQIAAIDNLGVNEAIIYGEQEDKKHTVTIRNLDTGEQREASQDSLVDEYLE